MASLGFTSCQNEENQLTDTLQSGQTVRMVVHAERDAVNLSRTALEESDGNIVCTWTEGDKLLVTNANGGRVGVLALTEGAGQNVAQFEGNLLGVTEGENQLNFFYLGTETDPNNVTGSFTADFSEQNGVDMTKYDVLSSSLNLNVIDGMVYAEDLGLERNFSFGHFELVFPQGVAMNGEEVTISGDNFYNKVAIDLKNAVGTPSAGPVKVTNGTGDFYIMLVPGEGVAPTFSVTIDEKEYVGSLGARDIAASKFLRKSQEMGVQVQMEEVKQVELDGSILGMMWAPCNNRSWIDCTLYQDDAFLFTYIPTIPFAEQGISMTYNNSTVFSDTDNPYAFHYQWDRDFGFIASNAAYDQAYTKVPNSSNIPISWGNQYQYYSYSTRQIASHDISYNYYDTYIYPSSSSQKDWCAMRRTEWVNRLQNYELSAAPKGFKIPSYDEWKQLLPKGGTDETYDYSTTGYGVDGGTAYPFYVKNMGDGTSVIWSMWQSTAKKYLDVRRVVGTYQLEDINEKVLSECELPLQLPADGYRTNGGTLSWQVEGWYWASNSANATDGTAYCFTFKIDVDNKTIRLRVGSQPRKYAFSLRVVKTDN